MAAMDRAFVAFNAALTNLQAHIGTVQREQFLQQAQAAARLQMFEYAIGALILAMVAGATMYGLKLARNVQAVERERDRSQEILEARVAERTSALSNANAALQESEQDRARLLRQVLSAQEEERRRIARDLHDEIGQSLTSLVLGLRSLESSADVEEAHYRAGELRGVAANTLDAVRRLARGLRPSVLDDLGLAAALERLASEFRRAPELDVRLQVTEQGRLPAEVETAVYRIVQEALTNTARHANAGQVVVTLQATPPQLRLCIEDNGRGLPGQPGEAPPASSPGFGISGMRERARLLDGSFRIESLPGRGTRIAVEIPVTETVDVEDSRLLDR
jgi:two-component system sensor histidine kinase UhpB